MVYFRGLFRFLITLTLACCFIISCLLLWFPTLSLIDTSYYNPDNLDKLVFYEKVLLGKELYYADSVDSFQSRVLKEFEYKEKLAGISDAEIQILSERYFRNISVQWGSRGLLPPSKPLFHEKCLDYLDKNYDVTISIVIPFHNEVSVLLLRLLTTIMHRTLPKYLEEIILIDDASTFNITDEILTYAHEQRMPLRLILNDVRLGVPNSRLKGISAAKGKVVVILDSHMEVSELWLEPLLNTLLKRPKSVVVPLIDMITETDYIKNADRIVSPYLVKPRYGHGIITFHPLSDSENNSNRSSWEPFASPGLLGGALAAFKTTLEEFYPAGIVGNSWGVENTRISFRMWMCGGGIWVAPCSQTLHPNGMDLNLMRYFPPGKDSLLLSDLMDENTAELINFMFTDNEKEKVVSKVTNEEDHQKIIWDLADEIRASFDPDQRNCLKYEYYRDHVFGDYMSWESDQFDFVGEVKSYQSPDICLELLNDSINVYQCRKIPPALMDSHLFGFTKNHHVRNADRESLCFDTSDYSEGSPVKTWNCHVSSPVSGTPYDSQHFEYKEETQQIMHPPSERCLELVGNEDKKVLLYKCKVGKSEQRWTIETSFWF